MATDYLIRAGIPRDRLTVATSDDAERFRTFESAVAVGLVVAVSAAMLSNSASASSGTTNWILDKLPHVRIHPPPHHGPPPAVPEVNTGLVLLPIVLAILLFTSRRFLRRGLENR